MQWNGIWNVHWSIGQDKTLLVPSFSLFVNVKNANLLKTDGEKNGANTKF